MPIGPLNPPQPGGWPNVQLNNDALVTYDLAIEEGPAASISKQAEKPVTAHSTIREVFRTKQPPRLTNERAEEFIKFNNLILDFPYSFKDSKALVGLEVEVENVLHIDPNIPLGFWEITEDGSLRNNGREFKTIALPLHYVEYALEQLRRGLNNTVDFSVRTSVHVHQDVRGMTLNQLICLLLTYNTVENLLFKFAGNNRRNSIYCVPLRETDLMNQFTTHNSMIKNLCHINSAWHKYSALNLLPISSFGTVEYRHMPGTLDVKRLLVWVDLLSRLKLFAYRMEYEELSNLVCELNTNSAYLHFVEKVFGDLTIYLDTHTLREDLEQSVYLVKHACIANEFHSKIVNSKINPNSPLGIKWKPKDLESLIGRHRASAFKAWIAIFFKDEPIADLLKQYAAVEDNPRMYIAATKSLPARKLLEAALGMTPPRDKDMQFQELP